MRSKPPCRPCCVDPLTAAPRPESDRGGSRCPSRLWEKGMAMQGRRCPGQANFTVMKQLALDLAPPPAADAGQFRCGAQRRAAARPEASRLGRSAQSASSTCGASPAAGAATCCGARWPELQREAGVRGLHCLHGGHPARGRPRAHGLRGARRRGPARRRRADGGIQPVQRAARVVAARCWPAAMRRRRS